MHPRLTPANSRVAHASLRGLVDAPSFTEGETFQIGVGVADLLRSPNGSLDSQLLLGSEFLVLENNEATGYAFGQACDDGYVGYLRATDLKPAQVLTHRISGLGSHAYPEANMKTRPVSWLPFGARVRVRTTVGKFAMLEAGSFVPEQHLSEITQSAPDFVSVFETFAGIPYLWGGSSTLGLDCSGALQLALHAAGIDCPRDADMQEDMLGHILDELESAQRGDIVFWKGHVGVMQDSGTLLHANAHHMAVASEPFQQAVERIQSNGGGPVTVRKRL